MVAATSTPFEPLVPRFEHAPHLVLAGLIRRYTCDQQPQIPAQWAEFSPYIDTVPGRRTARTYGVCQNGTRESFEYLCAVEVADESRVPATLTTMMIPAQLYAVFTHRGHVSEIASTVDSIFTRWLPQSGRAPTHTPDFFERYGEDFDPIASAGVVEIWVPVSPQ